MIDQTPPATTSGTPGDDESRTDSGATSGALGALPSDITNAPPADDASPADAGRAPVTLVDEITLVTESDTGSIPQAHAQISVTTDPTTTAFPADGSDLPDTVRLRPAAAKTDAPPSVTGATAGATAGDDPYATDPLPPQGARATEGDPAAHAADATTAPDAESTAAAAGRTPPLAPAVEHAEYQLYTGEHLSSLADRLAFRAYERGGQTRELPHDGVDSGELLRREQERREELTRRRAISVDVERGVLPFTDLDPPLSRSDIQWLLSTHESGGYTGPVDWSDPAQRKRVGLDLRGADLRDVDLSGLPLARVRLGPTGSEWLGATQPGRDWAAAHLDGANLRGTHLEGALMRGTHLQGAHLNEANLADAVLIRAHLQRADLSAADLPGADLSEAQVNDADCSGADFTGANLHGASLQGAILHGAQLAGADLHGAHLERADLDAAHLERANFNAARLEGASLNLAHMESAMLYTAHLEWASLNAAHLEGALCNAAHFEHATLSGAFASQTDLQEAHLEGTDLRGAHLEGADLRRATLDGDTNLADVSLSDKQHGPVALGDMHWGGVDLTVVNWDPVLRLGDERSLGPRAGLAAQRAVVRAYRQMATQLRAQGMHEEADRYTYRALVRRRGIYLRQGHVPQYLIALFLRYFTGFGYKPARALVWYVLLLVGFALAYLQLGYIQNGQLLLTGGSFAQWSQALLLSLTAFHGRGFLQPLQTIGDLTSILMLIESIIGLLLEIAFVVSLALRHLGAK